MLIYHRPNVFIRLIRSISAKPRNLVRLAFIFILFIVGISIYIKYADNKYALRGLILIWLENMIGVYLFTVSLWLADLRNKDDYKNIWSKVLIRVFMLTVSLLFLYNIFGQTIDIFRESFANTVEIKEGVVVEELWTAYKSLNQSAYLKNDINSYIVVSGNVELVTNHKYKVGILPHTHLIWGIEEESLLDLNLASNPNGG